MTSASTREMKKFSISVTPTPYSIVRPTKESYLKCSHRTPSRGKGKRLALAALRKSNQSKDIARV